MPAALTALLDPYDVDVQRPDEFLAHLEWKRFEDVVAAYVQELGLAADDAPGVLEKEHKVHRVSR